LIAQTPRNGCEINAPDRMALFDAMTSLYRTKTAHLVKGH